MTLFFMHDIFSPLHQTICLRRETPINLTPLRSSYNFFKFSIDILHFFNIWSMHDIFDKVIEALDILVITISNVVLGRCDSLDLHWWLPKLTWHMKPELDHKSNATMPLFSLLDKGVLNITLRCNPQQIEFLNLLRRSIDDVKERRLYVILFI